MVSRIYLARIAIMKKLTFIVIFSLIFTLISVVYSSPSFAKKRCKPFQKKLHNIQAMQRNGHSLKRGESLRAKEDKARDKWWDCERSSLAKFKAEYGSKKKKKAKKSNKSKRAKKNSYYFNSSSSLSSKNKKAISYSQNKQPTFNQSSAIVIKSKYQGNKMIAWLEFYSKPIKCQRPKKLSIFAYCNEHKIQQQSEFDKTYRD